MDYSFEQLMNASAELPSDKRVELAHFLLRSVEPVEEGWSEAWKEEISRRLAEIESGSVVGIPADEALGELRKRLP